MPWIFGGFADFRVECLGVFPRTTCFACLVTCIALSIVLFCMFFLGLFSFSYSLLFCVSLWQIQAALIANDFNGSPVALRKYHPDRCPGQAKKLCHWFNWQWVKTEWVPFWGWLSSKNSLF